MSAIRPLFVVAGIGNGSGTGASSARLFSKLGYRVALISRGPDHLNKLANEINRSGGEVRTYLRELGPASNQNNKAVSFPISDYTPASIHSAFSDMRNHFSVSSSPLRVAVFNAAHGIWKPFLDITEDEVRESLDVNVIAAFAFSKEVLLEFTKNELEQPSEGGKAGARKRGTLIFTGATSSIRGNIVTSAFAAGKSGTRALSQSLAKEFGKQNIHVAHSIIDGNILTDRVREYRNDPAWEANRDAHLNPDSIARAYLNLVEQDSSAWAWEIDLRPAHEKW